MPATLIDGKALADTILDNLKTQIDALGQPLHLAAVCGGDDPGLKSFVKLKQRAAQSVGIELSPYFFEADDKEDAAATLNFLAADETVDGIFIELPLPQGWDADGLIGLIPTEKDVDALTNKSFVSEPAVAALKYVIEEYGIALRGVSAAVVGQGRLVGAPIARWLGEQGARVQMIDVATKNPELIAQSADMVVTGVGQPGLVTETWIKEGAVVIDFGYGKNKNDAYVGDVDFDAVSQKARLITPVPGGMGPLLIAAVLENLLKLATR